LILVFYAFAREIGPFKRRIKNRAAFADGGLSGFRAEIGDKQYTVAGHGIGIRRAGEMARRAFEMIPAPEMVIATGVAGALSSGLKPGDLVLAHRVIQLSENGENARHILTIDREHLEDIGRSLTIAGLKYSTGALMTVPRVLATAAEKRHAKVNTGAIAVDMETAAIAAEAHARGIPFVAIRAVLDEVDDDVSGAAEMAGEDGFVRPLAATAYLVRNPSALLKLPRMIRNLARATNSIADALEAIAHEGRVPRVRKKSATGRAESTHRR
jgi:adenosylhomocysteine nucleosidase